MNTKTKKKFKAWAIFLAGVFILQLLLTVLTTFAWFTDSFTSEKISLSFGTIKLEKGTAGNPVTGMTVAVSRDNAEIDTTKLMPGDTITLTMTVQLTDESEPAYYLIYLDHGGLFSCEKSLFFKSGSNIYATDGTTTNVVTAAGTLGTDTITNVVGSIEAGAANKHEITMTMQIDTSATEESISTVGDLSCAIYAIQQANITESEAFEELYKNVPGTGASYLANDWLTKVISSAEANSITIANTTVATVTFTGTTPDASSGYTETNSCSVGMESELSSASAYDSGTSPSDVYDVTAYYKTNTTNTSAFDILIYSPVTVYAPQDSSRLFMMSTLSFGSFQSSCTSIEFNGKLDTSHVELMNYMFAQNKLLTKLDLSFMETRKVSDMTNMFSRCYNLSELNIDNFDTSKVTYMGGMFYECSSLTSLDLSNFSTSNVTNMYEMFYYCSSLTSLTLGTNFDTSKVTTMYNMFSGCSALTSLDLSNFDMTKVTKVTNMLDGCTSLKTLKAPYNVQSSYPITLPATFKNTSGTSATEITSSNGLASTASAKVTLTKVTTS